MFGRFIIKYYFFLLAYLPLYLIAAVKSLNYPFWNEKEELLPLGIIIKNNTTSLCLFILFILLTFSFLIYSKYVLRVKEGNRIFKIKSVNHQPEKYIEYLGTYILPFIALETQDIFDKTAFILMFLMLGYVFIKTNLIYTNPTLSFFNYKIISVTTYDEEEFDCITTHDFNKGEEPTGKKLAKNTFILEKWKPQNSKK